MANKKEDQGLCGKKGTWDDRFFFNPKGVCQRPKGHPGRCKS